MIFKSAYWNDLYLCWWQSYSGLRPNIDMGTAGARLTQGNTAERERETRDERRDEERDEEGVKEVYTKCIRKKQTHDITASRAAFCPGESCTVPGTFIRCIMILTISSMEGRCEGSLDQQRVIRLSMGLGRFLMRGGRVPERTNK